MITTQRYEGEPWRAGPPLALMLLSILTGCGGSTPEGLGPRDGRLAPCPSTPNCVNTGDRHPVGTQPIVLRDASDATWDAVVGVILSMPRIRLMTRDDRYLHVEQRTRFLRFVDDLELLLRPDGELVVRSASRVGRGDFGVNTRRVESVRSRLTEAGLVRE